MEWNQVQFPSDVVARALATLLRLHLIEDEREVRSDQKTTYMLIPTRTFTQFLPQYEGLFFTPTIASFVKLVIAHLRELRVTKSLKDVGVFGPDMIIIGPVKEN
jgi:hypothetical protein